MGWRRFFRRTRRDSELAEDMRFYLEAETDENVARGMPRDLARKQALRKLGNVTRIREEVFTENSLPFFETLCQDVLYGFRQLRRNASFTAAAVITLALGIGACTAIFSIVDSVLLRPLPYHDPGRLVWATERFMATRGAGAVLGPDFAAWLQGSPVFQQIEAFRPEGPGMSLAGISGPVPVSVTEVTAGFFSMLGLLPVAGRSFTVADGKEGKDRVLLISENLWRSQFGGTPAILGKTVRLDDSSYTVIGVMRQIEFPQADVWTPMVLSSRFFSPRSRPLALVSVIGRIKPGIALAGAESNLSMVTHRIDREYPPQFVRSRDRNIELVPLHDLLVRNARSLLLILLGAVGFVFLIACANVANLSFSRGAGRLREFAIRGALGAGRSRVIRQLLTESFLLAILGSALGLLCGLWSLRLLKPLIPSGLLAEIAMDPRILAFALGITILATLVFGLAPALASSRVEIVEALQSGGTRSGTGRGSLRLRSGLVISEIALAVVLLVGAGLLLRSFVLLTNVRLGFNPDHVLTAEIVRPMTNGLQTPSQVPFFNEVLRNVRALPGVRHAGATDRAPLNPCAGGAVRVRGAVGDIQPVCITTISPEYFDALEIPVLQGRPFDARDSSDAPLVVILNEALAREAYGKLHPLGRQIGVYGLHGLSWRTVVGVTALAKNSTLLQEPWPEIFVPYPQALLPLTANLMVRADGNPLALAASIRNAVQAVDRNQSVLKIQTLQEVIAKSSSPQWFRMLLLGLFALLALVLAAIGVFGVMAYSVAQRTHEIGVRMALGAKPKDVLLLAASRGIFTSAVGLGIGVLGSVGLTRFLSGLLYEVKPTDVTTFAGAIAVLTATALLACYLPARRATRVDPLTVLRND